MTNKNVVPNRLINEKSPYLLQHAHNPVDWFPWGDEAFKKAGKENKPVFLSIGYSTCHWCHVMAHECFEDEEVSSLMNDAFINIKVDREERPDIDSVYMSVCQMMTGSGGWPLSILMTPDKKPFYSATYIPKHGRYSRIGMVELVPKIKELWAKDRQELIKSAEKVSKTLMESESKEYGEMIGNDVIESAFEQFRRNFDRTNGGFGGAPKFPTPHNLMFLLRYWKRRKEQKALEMVTKTLDAMAQGGIFDHLGYGFHRYSTDSKWFLPHFEKMLYDQALLIMAYTECYQATGIESYRSTAEKIIEYVMRDLSSEEGAFYSAEDADSEGEEGKFYVWSLDEVQEVLGEEDSRIAADIFNISSSGNFKDEASGKRTGLNIMHLKVNLEDIITKSGDKLTAEKIENIRKRLFEEREKRERPHRDDKILTDWNGLMIAALSKAAAAFDKAVYLDTAKKAADFFLLSFDNNRLMHRFRKGEWHVPGNTDDYSFLIMGLIEIYEAGFDVKYLKKAFELNNELIDKFWDNEGGGLYFTAFDSEKLLIRSKEIYDGAIPSGNSAALLNFLRLSRISGSTELENLVEKMIRAFSNDVENVPYAHSFFLSGLDFFINESLEIVVSGKSDDEETIRMIREINRRFIPQKVLLLNPAEVKEPVIFNLSNYIEHQGMIDSKSAVYICKNYACSRPVSDIDSMIKLLS